MIAGLLLMLAVQDVPAPVAALSAVEGTEEIVVRATFGTTTMLFDKGADNKLRNCRIMVSSGSERRDTNACQATPVCFAKTVDVVTDCVDFTSLEPVKIDETSGGLGTGGVALFEIPKLVKPKPVPPTNIAGPIAPTESRDTDRQRVKLPPLPRDDSNVGGPVIRITNAQDK